MPIVLLAGIMAMLTFIAAMVSAVAWNRIPATRWFAVAMVALDGGLAIAAVMHMRASRADLADGVAHIKTGWVTRKRTSGRRSTWFYTTVDGIGEVEVSREQYEAMVIGSAYTVSYSPRVKRAWTTAKA